LPCPGIAPNFVIVVFDRNGIRGSPSIINGNR
jgi:hypothetical protein